MVLEPAAPSIQDADLACPMCEYNLRGLTEPRCPECGYRFDWAELRDARIRPHPYLFEHHPEKNFRSFWRTAWGGLRPFTFWRTLHPAMPSRPRRLLLYWLLCAILGFLGVLAIVVPACIETAAAARVERVRVMSPNARSLYLRPPAPAQLDNLYPLPPRLDFFLWVFELRTDAAIAVELLVLVLCWPWLTLAALLVFRWSMRRARPRCPQRRLQLRRIRLALPVDRSPHPASHPGL